MSSTVITKEIQEAIERNLPAQVGDLLQARLTQADRDASMLAAVKADLGRSEDKVRKLEADKLELAGRVKTQEDLDARERDLNKRQHDLDLAVLQIKLEAAEKSREFARDVALGLVRNVEYRKVLSNNEGNTVNNTSGASYSTVTTSAFQNSSETGSAA